MQKKLPLIVITVLIVLIVLGIFAFYRYTRHAQVLRPSYATPETQQLGKILQSSSLSFEDPPRAYNDRIEASISGILVYFSKDKDLKTQVRALQLVLPRLKMDVRPAKFIDVRFDKVVIHY